MGGWFKLHRELFDSDIWNDVTTFRLFVYLIGRASHVDGFKYKGMTLNKGQYVRSYRKLADDLSYKEGRGYKKHSISTIKRCVSKLIESERLNANETELGTLFTVINYARYQQEDDLTKGTKNALIDEVGTKAELKRNEGGTKTEQDQELKHLSTKELKESISSGELENDEIIKLSIELENEYCAYLGVLNNSIPSFEEMKLIVAHGIPNEFIISKMKESIDQYEPRHPKDKINSFGYCAPYIYRSWHEQLEKSKKVEGANFTPSSKKNFKKGGTSSKPRITLPTYETQEVSDEELNRMLEKAKQLETG